MVDKLARKRASARASMQRYRERHREQWLATCRAAQARYRKRHPERVNEIQRRFRQRLREQSWQAALAEWRVIARVWLDQSDELGVGQRDLGGVRPPQMQAVGM